MKIRPEQDLSCNEIEIIIKYPQKDRRVLRIIDFLQSFDVQIKCAGEDAERMIHIMDIYYIESVDKKTFVYLENAVYRTEFRLYQKKYGKYFGYNRNFPATALFCCVVFSCKLYLFGDCVSDFWRKYHYAFRNTVYQKIGIKKYCY